MIIQGVNLIGTRVVDGSIITGLLSILMLIILTTVLVLVQLSLTCQVLVEHKISS
jgi:hypothetical protein